MQLNNGNKYLNNYTDSIKMKTKYIVMLNNVNNIGTVT